MNIRPTPLAITRRLQGAMKGLTPVLVMWQIGHDTGLSMSAETSCWSMLMTSALCCWPPPRSMHGQLGCHIRTSMR